MPSIEPFESPIFGLEQVGDVRRGPTPPVSKVGRDAGLEQRLESVSEEHGESDSFRVEERARPRGRVAAWTDTQREPSIA